MRLEFNGDEVDIERLKELISSFLASTSPNEKLVIELLRFQKQRAPEARVVDKRKIIAFREAKGWNQAQLAKKAHVDASTLSRIERGHIKTPRDEILESLAKQLSISTQELLHTATD